MSKFLVRALLAATVALGAASADAQMTKMVGGAPMYPSKNIVQNAVHSKDHTTPTNEAFAKLPPGTVKTLLEPANKGQLTAVLTYHVIPGKLTASELSQKIDSMGGHFTINTVQGEPLTFSKMNGGIAVTDAKGGTAMVTIPDVLQSNGVIHVINSVLLPG